MSKVCAQCGAPFAPHTRHGDRQRCCSNECSRRWSHRHRPTVTRNCQHCGREFTAGPGKVYCDRTCMIEGKRRRFGKPIEGWLRAEQRVITRWLRAERHWQRSVRRWLKAEQAWSPRHCLECGHKFTPQNRASAYCCPTCRNRAHRTRRRARKANAFTEQVWRRKVFERDDWRCQLCGKKTRPGKTAPHPEAPVLDHIVPLAVGGGHEYANIQTAHHRCNCVKSAGTGPRGDQLRLLG